ncbi:MAG: nucleotide exchange factor GrpE [Prolixibacteraceae bacterium]
MMTKKKDEHKKHDKDNLNPNTKYNEYNSQNNPENEQDIPEAIPVIFDKETELENKITEITASLAVANDKYLRLSAEFDNFRKRTLKEKMDLMKNASESVMVNFLPVIDDVERAMKAIEISDNLATTKEGITLIYNKFKEFTKNNGVVEMEANGLELNTDHHEAITKIPAPSEELKGKIVDVVQKGYLLNEKVIRFAKVVIGE